MSIDIEQTLIDKINSMRQAYFLGADFDDALEMLPAESRASEAEAGSAPLFTARALTGRLQCNLPSSFRYCGGFDGGCVVNYFGAFADVRIFDFFDTWLSGAKIRQDRDEDFYVTYQGLRFLVYPHGANGGVHFKYILQIGGLKFLFFGKPDSGGKPNVQIDFSYEALRDRSIQDARIDAEEVLRRLGFCWDRVSFQRIDFNVTTDIPFEEFDRAFREGRVVSRVRNFTHVYSNKSSGRIGTYIRGGKDIQVCIYDKLHEITKHYNENKYNDVLDVLGDGHNLSRVEFRLSSSYFNSIGCDSFDKLAEYLPSIIEYLCCRWLRILDGVKVRGRENKQEVSEVWKKVYFAFYKTFIEDKCSKPLVKRKRHNINNVRLLKQAVGCLTSAMAKTKDAVRDFDSYVSDAFEIFLNYRKLAYRLYLRKKEFYDVVVGNYQ